MTEQELKRQKFSDYLMYEAITIYVASERAEPENGSHANTIALSAFKATEKVFVSKDVDGLNVLRRLKRELPANRIWKKVELPQDDNASFADAQSICGQVIMAELLYQFPDLMLDELDRIKSIGL